MDYMQRNGAVAYSVLQSGLHPRPLASYAGELERTNTTKLVRECYRYTILIQQFILPSFRIKAVEPAAESRSFPVGDSSSYEASTSITRPIVESRVGPLVLGKQFREVMELRRGARLKNRKSTMSGIGELW